MEIHDLIQGSPEWHAYRANHRNASDAPAMMGCSPYKKRSELLHQCHTGLAAEVSATTQGLFDNGHRFEALARPLAESIVGEDLYPVTCSLDKLSASLDGLTMMETIAWEHKSLNDEIRAAQCAADLGLHYRVQMEQQLLISGAEKCLFQATKWSNDGELLEDRHFWYEPDLALRGQILLGWEQFEADLAVYEPKQVVDKAVADVIMALPALVVQTRGEVVQSNLPAFQVAATEFIAKIKTDLKTDEDFANAEATVKFCEKAEKDLELTKAAVLGQAATIDDVMRTIDNISGQLRAKRLALGKLVEKRKTEIKETILSTARLAYSAHVDALEAEIKPIRLVQISPDFAGAMKNKRTLASLNDAVDTLLASAKIATSQTAADYRAKQTWCKEHAAGYGFLFMDMQQIIVKAADDFQLLVTTRIADHKRAEEAKAEAERARIREEERVKAEAAAAETARLAQVEAKRVADEAAAVEQARVAADTKRQLEAQAASIAAARAAEQPVLAPAAVSPVAAIEPAPAAAPRPILNPAAAWPAPATAPTLRLGQIAERLGFSLPAEFMRTLGFEPAGRDKAAVLYHESQFPLICAALVAHIESVQIAQAA